MRNATWKRVWVAGLGLMLALGMLSPANASLFAEEYPAEEQAGAEEEATAEAAEAPAAPAATAPSDVWWGNRSVSFRNYIPFEGPTGGRHGIICDQNMIDCKTGLPCTTCDIICPDCNCTYDIYFDQKKSVLSPEAKRELDKAVAQVRGDREIAVSIQGSGARATAVRRYLNENGIGAGRISEGPVTTSGGTTKAVTIMLH